MPPSSDHAESPPRAWLFWSTGKDSAHSLHALREAGEVDVVGLVTTIVGAPARAPIHGVSVELLSAQARSVGLPVQRVPLRWPCPNAAYEEALRAVWRRAAEEGISVVAFGDLFLRDIREYREQLLAGTGLRAVFPLWGRDTRELAAEMLAGGQGATVVSIAPDHLDETMLGRDLDGAWLNALPEGVDPCGENGEFHTFATDGPAFRWPIAVTLRGIARRDGMLQAELAATPGGSGHGVAVHSRHWPPSPSG